jgi:UDP:flavonoid glycosyltransferase YjiC (YdhE family)
MSAIADPEDRFGYPPAVRVLCSVKSGSAGHLLPILPLAGALRAVGHEVAIASADDRRAAVDELGFAFFQAGLPFVEALELIPALFPTWPWGGDLDHTFSLLFTRVFAPRSARDLLDVLGEYAPDVVVHEVSEFGAPIAAARYGIPWATHGLGLPIPERVLRAAGTEIASLWESFGLAPRRFGGALEHLYLDPCPRSLDPGDGSPDGVCQQIAPLSADLASVVSRSRPLVYATLGTARFNRAGPIWRDTLDAVDGLDIDVIVTVGRDNDPARLGNVPDNVQVKQWHHQADLMPQCSAVICHGGSGTVFTALGYGVPVLAMPQGADQFRNADALERTGAGRQHTHDGPTAGLRETLQGLLDDSAYRAAAMRIAHEIAQMPSPSAAIGALEALTSP